ncbi:Cholesterol 7-alpha-monooxygenase protein [Dioscorea alata]|uniref:Cholesterol 7-alpha-monooxygenase protein n=1 Tax=Dioscorea alata TaxID=55571 RepID=A0ACB7WTB2_DIOAL|nr:Cholesterol 7-alpha-monooxygenase protein [Dioscorea alata]
MKGIGRDPFEFCDVCNLNHDHSRHHKYLPSHLHSLSSLFSRFQSKLSDLRFFLKNPELDSHFACENEIEHMASEEHQKNLKNFLWKNGGRMDRVDLFRVSESNLSKWKKECELSKCAPLSASKQPIGPVPGPSKDIQFEHEFGHTDSFDNNSLIFFNSSTSHNVMPLQKNFHTAGAPPWLLSSEENDVNLASKRCLLDSIGSSTAAQNGRSKKLNPKRVGAAWAEKRRLELELEKQGKITQKPHDANWLPNFGRVWQAGTRKESRKEFEKEKRELSEKDQQSDPSFIIQPYLSKRMVND